MNSVRMAVLGLGHAGSRYAALLQEGQVKDAALTAVCSRDPSKMARFPAGVARFTAWADLLKARAADALVIATPHPAHVEAGVEALKAGWHVLVEKPLASRLREAQRLVEAHRGCEDRVFAIMLNLRASAVYQEIWRRVREWDLGRIRRVHWTFTEWYRTEAYFKSSWRGTWAEEGGGLLVNQVIHHLDLLSWWFGKPVVVGARACWGKYHRIEVEDEVVGWWQYADGMTVSLVFSTGEAPGFNHLEIVGEQGSLAMNGDELTEYRLDVSLSEHRARSPSPDEKPPCRPNTQRFKDTRSTHAALLQNFVGAIREGRPLMAPARDGLVSLEIANAMQLAALTGQDVTLPLDVEMYENEIRRIIARRHA